MTDINQLSRWNLDISRAIAGLGTDKFFPALVEFIDTIPAFDLLTGSAQARTAILNGEDARDIADAVSVVQEDWESFALAAQQDAARAEHG